MAKTVFSNGMRVSPQHFNALNNPQFVVDEDGEEFDGQHYRLRDSSLSNDPTQIKGRFTAFEGELRVAAGAGLSVVHNGGRVALPTGVIAVVPPGVITGLPDNSMSFIFVNKDGVVSQGATPDLVRCLMARVTTSGGSVTQIEDLRQRFAAETRGEVSKVFGGGGTQGDVTITGSATLNDGLYYFNNLIVQNGAVLNIGRFAKIFCAGNVQINGSVNVQTATRGGTGYRRSASIESVPNDGEGFGSGSVLVGGTPYSPILSPVGSGGAGSYVHPAPSSSAVIAPGSGGRGGGGLWIECGGNLTVGSTGAITANGSAATSSTFNSGTGDYYIGGAGGGSGGTIILTAAGSLRVEAGASISCNGGNGAPAIRSGTSITLAGGGGGGGGTVWLICPSGPVVLGNISVNGGSGGGVLGSGPVTHGSAGGGGNGGAGGSSGGGSNLAPAFAGATGRILISSFLPVG